MINFIFLEQPIPGSVTENGELVAVHDQIVEAINRRGHANIANPTCRQLRLLLHKIHQITARLRGIEQNHAMARFSTPHFRLSYHRPRSIDSLCRIGPFCGCCCKRSRLQCQRGSRNRLSQHPVIPMKRLPLRIVIISCWPCVL